MSYKYIVTLLHRAAKSYQGGIKGLSDVMNKNQVVFSNKLNPSSENNHITFEEAAEVIELTQDRAAVEALARLVGCTLVTVPECEQLSARDVLTHFVLATRRCGLLGEQILAAKNPDSEWGERISPAELKKIEAEALPLIQDVLQIINLSKSE